MAHPITTAALIVAVVAASPTLTLASPLGSFRADMQMRTELFNQVDSDVSAFSQPGDDISLNPQPLPPKYRKRLIRLLGDELMLNPQPLPPRVPMLTGFDRPN